MVSTPSLAEILSISNDDGLGPTWNWLSRKALSSSLYRWRFLSEGLLSWDAEKDPRSTTSIVSGTLDPMIADILFSDSVALRAISRDAKETIAEIVSS